MSVQNPAMLWFALLLIVPLLLYLLPMPRRLIKSSALYLWHKFLSSEPFGRTSERFRRALGLALLVAILASLILAAADLAVGSNSIKARSVVIVMDVSASMNAVIDGKTNLSRAKEAAAQLIDSLDSQMQVAVVEAAGEIHVVAPMRADARDAVAKLRQIEPFEGPVDLRRSLAEVWKVWGDPIRQAQGGPALSPPNGASDVEVYVFTDNELPKTAWGRRAHAWIAPSIGDAGNAAIIAMSAERASGAASEQRGADIVVNFTLANYGRDQRTLSGVIIANGNVRGSFDKVVLEGGKTALRTVKFEESSAATIEVKLEGNADALAVDDNAFATVPALDDLRVGVAWPDGKRRNDFVAAALAAMQAENVIGPIVENPVSSAPALPVTIYVNHLPPAWPEGNAIVLYPLRSGVVEVTGLRTESVTVARQAESSLLADVDFRGLQLKDAVLTAVPSWATPLVWADNNLPLVWAGQTGKTKVLFVGIPILPSGSRLPLVASFPVLMRNTFHWMLPTAEALHPGQRVGDWTSRKAGLIKDDDGHVHAFSVTSAQQSDLRRPAGLKGEEFGRRKSLAQILVMIAAVLLPLEWGLFHKRLTE